MHPTLNVTRWARPPQASYGDGALETLKLIGLSLMTVDHVNKYLFNGTSQLAFNAGRLALPIFCFVLAYNLARHHALQSGVFRRTASRLAVFGAIASVPFVLLGGLIAPMYPLNVMFALLVITGVAYLLSTRRVWAAVGLFCIGGAVVEFWWPAVLFGVTAWLYCRRPSWGAIGGMVLACMALAWVNGTSWGMAALPIILAARRTEITVPRLRWVFYAYYPAHLAALWAIRIPMANAGYLFF